MTRLLLTSGRGPAECRLALRHVLVALEREAEDMEVSLDVAPGPDPDGHGPASAVAVLSGGATRGLAARWLGTVLWVCPSPLRPHHGRKNWYVGISVLAEGHAAAPRLDPHSVRMEAIRAGGPGGQHQNKTASAVRAVHVPTGHSVVVRDGRSQHQNRKAALDRLAALLAADRQAALDAERTRQWSGHNTLERGRPVRRFKGQDFKEA